MGERIEDGGTVHITPATLGTSVFTRGRDGLSPIDWIKRYRSIAGVTLREAKDAYDAGRTMPESSDEIDAALARDARQSAMRAAATDLFEALEFARQVIAGRSDQSLADKLALQKIVAALSKASPHV